MFDREGNYRAARLKSRNRDNGRKYLGKQRPFACIATNYRYI